MNDFKRIFLLLLPVYVSLIVLSIFAFKQCGSQANVSTIITKDSSTVYLKDTARHSHSTTNIYPVTTITVAPPSGNIDTAAILAAFYNKHFYKQELGDSLISITTEDSVQCNSIDYSKITWQFKKPYQVIKTVSVTVTNTVDKTNGFYIGAFAQFNKQVTGIGPEAQFIFKNNAFGAGYDILNRSPQIKYLRKIGK